VTYSPLTYILQMGKFINMDIRVNLGKRIKEIRLNKKLSQEALAFKSQLNRTYINGIENGRRNVSIINIHKIANALDVSLTELFKSDVFTFK